MSCSFVFILRVCERLQPTVFFYLCFPNFQLNRLIGDIFFIIFTVRGVRPPEFFLFEVVRRVFNGQPSLRLQDWMKGRTLILQLSVLCFLLVFQRNFVPVMCVQEIRPSTFFLCLASSNRPRFSRFKKKVTQEAMKATTHCFKHFILI